jgi:hypothetical protein
MERERATQTQRVVMEDGREGIVVGNDPDPITLRVKVRFEDGSEEWVDIERTSGVETASAHPATQHREFGRG